MKANCELEKKSEHRVKEKKNYNNEFDENKTIRMKSL